MMGDHRISLTIKAEFHGKTYEINDAWWNYDGHNGVDERVIRFFEDMWADGYARWHEGIMASLRKQAEREAEARERAELARLKAKYE